MIQMHYQGTRKLGEHPTRAEPNVSKLRSSNINKHRLTIASKFLRNRLLKTRFLRDCLQNTKKHLKAGRTKIVSKFRNTLTKRKSKKCKKTIRRTKVKTESVYGDNVIGNVYCGESWSVNSSSRETTTSVPDTFSQSGLLIQDDSAPYDEANIQPLETRGKPVLAKREVSKKRNKGINKTEKKELDCYYETKKEKYIAHPKHECIPLCCNVH